ncbi:MAG TPA: hypothetical protein VGM90_26280 [Kofleriaceae bacterium]|jgi:hypothetical protein
MRVDDDIRIYLGEFDPPPDGLFAKGTVGHALQSGHFDGFQLPGNAIEFQILGTQIVRRPDAKPSSGELEWCAIIDYTCTPPTEIEAWQKASWGYFGPLWLSQLESDEVIRDHFAAREIFDPGELRLAFRESCRPRMRPDTLPHWIENELLKASNATWATAEVGEVKASLYTDSIAVTDDGQIAQTVKAIQRLEFAFPTRDPIVNEQEVVLGAIYPEAYTAAPPTKPAVVAKFVEQLVKKQSKKLETILKKLGKTAPEEWQPSELLPSPNPIAMLQKALKISSVMES